MKLFGVLSICVLMMSCGTESKNENRKQEKIPQPKIEDQKKTEDVNKIDPTKNVDTNPSSKAEVPADILAILQPFELKKFQWNESVTSTYDDVMRCTPNENRFIKDDLPTNAHESIHMMAGHYNYSVKDAKGYFSYLGNGLGVYVERPQTNYKKIPSYIPKLFHHSRYDLYMVDQAKEWDDFLYLFDEWHAYAHDSTVAIEMQLKGIWPKNHFIDQLDGMTEFLVYATAALVALDELEPNYLKDNKKFIALYLFNANLTISNLKKGLTYSDFTHFEAASIFEDFKTSPEAERMRQVMKKHIGEDWYKKLMN